MFEMLVIFPLPVLLICQVYITQNEEKQNIQNTVLLLNILIIKRKYLEMKP